MLVINTVWPYWGGGRAGLKKIMIFKNNKKIRFFYLFDFFEIWYTQCQNIFDYQAIWCQYSYTSVRILCAFVLKKHTKLC